VPPSSGKHGSWRKKGGVGAVDAQGNLLQHPMVRASRPHAMCDESYRVVTRLGLTNASLVGVGVLRQVVKPAEQDLQEVQMMKMVEITTVY
jgi:hypothetical protein